MAAPSSFDLSTLNQWCGCRPGLSRAEVLVALHLAELETVPFGSNRLIATQDEWELELSFDRSDRLQQLSLDGEEILFAGKPLTGISIDEALQLIGPSVPAFWIVEQAGAVTEPAPALNDEQLLEDSTIWLPHRGWGLDVYEGKIFGVIWRAMEDVPGRVQGSVTEAQRQMSRREDLADHLQEKRMRSILPERSKDPCRYVRRALTLGAGVLIALTIRTGFEQSRRWAAAPVLPAKFISIERGPGKEFFDYLPTAVSKYLVILAGRWPMERSQTDLFRIEYLDPTGRTREARLEGAEFYVPPREVGDEVEITYLEGDPPQVKGPTRAREVGFIDYAPWVFTIGILWVIAQLLLSVVPALTRMLWRVARPPIATDPDRPQLR